MQMRSPSLTRIIIGIGLFIIGIVSLIMIFDPRGLLIPFEDPPLFVLAIFGVSMTIGFGAWLFSGYPLKMFLEPVFLVALWVFLFVLPILLLSFSIDVTSLVLSFSLLLLVLAYGNYKKWKEKHKKNTEKEGK